MSKKIKFSIITTLIIIVVISLVLVIKSDIFKTDGEKFVQLLTKDQYAVKLINDRYNKFSSNGQRKYNIALSNNFLSILDSSFGYIDGDLVLNTYEIKKGNKKDIEAVLKLGDIELQNIEIVKENETVALSVPNLFQNYIAINNENTDILAEKLGFSSGETKGNFKISKEAQIVIYKYGKVLADAINEYIEKENVLTKINGKELDSNCYKLILDKKELANIEFKLLEILKDDDETIDLIVRFVNESENFSNEEKEELTIERLKKDLKDLYEDLLINKDTIEAKDSVIEIYLYENKGKTVKTTIKILNENNDFSIDLEAHSTKENDYILVSLDIIEIMLNFKYEGSMNDKNYVGKLEVNTDGASSPIIDINIENVKENNRKIRKIKDLNVLLLNSASDEELEKFKNEIKNNLGISENYSNQFTLYEEGEFVIEDLIEKVCVLEASKEAYDKIAPNMKKEDIINILGEPSYASNTSPTEYLGWYFERKEGVYLVSVKLENGIVDTVYNDITSDMEKGVQVSKELGTDIDDLSEAIKDISKSMTKAEVKNILGDKCLEVYKDIESYSGLKWYDKKENSVIIEFDKMGKVFYINTVTMDM